ncbi:heat shock protein 27 [Teleopsis dalmanni]|uniref:heat shock protein 27 n=1 Tax=Teleopsis dalmanni TaxID=139649 RepID=UPI0018CD75CA|nr:heat shock protein 27 [Teleopsis dalmanni]
MAIVPLLANLARELESEYRPLGELEHLLDDDFGFGLHPVDIFRPRLSQNSLLLHPRRRFLPYDRNHSLARRLSARKHGAETSIAPVIGKDGFQVCIDTSSFKPNELTVKTLDNTVVIEGKHEEREDGHGLIQRHFVRKYTLPKDYDPKDVVSTISSDGVLTIKAPPPPNKALKENERIVQIQQTGPAYLSVKAPEQNDKADQGQNGSPEKMETSSK